MPIRRKGISLWRDCALGIFAEPSIGVRIARIRHRRQSLRGLAGISAGSAAG